MRILLFVFIVLLSGPAFADCSNPSSTAGGMDYSSGTGVRTICDGTNWLTYEEVQYGSGGARLVLNMVKTRPPAPSPKSDGCATPAAATSGSTATDRTGLISRAAAEAARPAAGDRQMQFNSGSSFGADSTFVYTSAGRLGLGTATPSADVRMQLYYDYTNAPWKVGFDSTVSMSGAAGASYTGLVGVSAQATTAVTGTGGPDAYAFYAIPRTTSDAAAQNAMGLRMNARTFASDKGYGVHVSDDDASTGGTQYGFYIKLDDTDVTRYGVYQETANNNYFAGNIGIGDTTPSVALDITGVMRAIDDAAACTATERGAIRFNSAGAALQVCSGAAWGAIGGGSSALSGITAATAANSINSANFRRPGTGTL